MSVNQNNANKRVSEAIGGYFTAFANLVNALDERNGKNSLYVLGELNIVMTRAMHEFYESMFENINRKLGDRQQKN